MRINVTTLCSIAALVALASASTGSVSLAKGSVHGKQTDVTSVAVRNGLKITLTVANGTQPFDGLVQTTITLKNVSKSPIGIINSACTGAFTHTEVLNRKDQAYPWPFPTFPLPCPRTVPTPLAPGHSVTAVSIVYLQSGRLRATVTTSASAFSYRSVSGSMLNLHLLPAPLEHVNLVSRPGGGYMASVRPAHSSAGKLYYSEIQKCLGGTGAFEGGLANVWQSTGRSSLSTDLLNSSCKHESWDFIAGWLGHRAVVLEFKVGG